MARKSKEATREYNKRYYQEHKEAINKRRKERGQNLYSYNEEYRRNYMREYMKKYRERRAAIDKLNEV